MCAMKIAVYEFFDRFAKFVLQKKRHPDTSECLYLYMDLFVVALQYSLLSFRRIRVCGLDDKSRIFYIAT